MGDKKLIGIFGGTFDPVHLGHINALNDLSKALEFDKIHWTLSARPPHKDEVSASVEQRFEMLQLALAPYSNYIADDCEIKREDKSYTFYTVQHFIERYPSHQLCLIIGMDSLAKLHTWHRYQEILEVAHIIVMNRPGYEVDVPDYLKPLLCSSVEELPNQKNASVVLFAQSKYLISSTLIRARLSEETTDSGFGLWDVAQKNELQKYLSDAVIDYIQRTQSYRIPSVKLLNKPNLEMNAEQIKNHVIEALDDLKGQDIRTIDITDISDFADYMIIASGTSNTHVKAMARSASDSLRKLGVKPIGENGADIGEWVLVDFGDVVLHVMRPQVREYYDLETLWDTDVRELVKQHREKQEAEDLD